MRLPLALSLILVLCGFSVSMLIGNCCCSPDDLRALISFKSALTDTTGVLSSWNESNHWCSWSGVKCGHRHPVRVVALQLGSLNLGGRISPSVGNLSFLRWLNLSNNLLHGPVPQELGQLYRLELLNLSANSLEGMIPATLGHCRKLVTVDLANNKIQGEIPTEIGFLSNLAVLKLVNNRLSGDIPVSLANLSALSFLDLSWNLLSSSVPVELGNLSALRILGLKHNILSGGILAPLGQLRNLKYLGLAYNNLSGAIPSVIWNISSLVRLDVSHNHLSGSIPTNVGHTAPRLQVMDLYFNQLSGQIPRSLGNATELYDIEINNNLFSGAIPREFGSLQHLQRLILYSNALEADNVDWNFMTALTNCSDLQYLILHDNKLRGAISGSVANLSTALEVLTLGGNEISGTVPVGIARLVNLNALLLANCSLSGSLPSSFGMLYNLQRADLSGNYFNGRLPSTLGNLTKLSELYLQNNGFSGSIPVTLGNLKTLVNLDLSHNQLRGTIPRELFSISTISTGLDLSYNQLEGIVPSEVGNLQNMVAFGAAGNKLSGEIPPSFGSCQLLRALYLQGNLFQGSISPSLARLKGLEMLDLSNNSLSGPIPSFLEGFQSLSYLNLSDNNFDGQVPTVGVFANTSWISIQGNKRLCGGIKELNLPPCSVGSGKRKHGFPLTAVAVSLTSALLCVLFLVFFIIYRCKSKPTERAGAILSFRGHRMVTYSDLVRATDAFSAANLIGAGSFGSVYKGTLHGENDYGVEIVAIKVLNLDNPGASKSFIMECETMRCVRHRNLLKIITLCSSIDFGGNDFKAVVFDFMPNGSIEGWLHPEELGQTEARFMDLHQRVNVALDVAFALEYLHQHGSRPIVHCDLKPSNILLDDDMVAHVGDFGLSRFLVEGSSAHEKSTSTAGLKGTIGYAPPEYGAGNRPSTCGDIYSYGILLLEMFTGKRPTDGVFKDGLSIHEYVEMSLPDAIMQVVDERLKPELGVEGVDRHAKSKSWSIVSLLRVGLWCSEELPVNRMPIQDVIKELRKIRELLMDA